MATVSRPTWRYAGGMHRAGFAFYRAANGVWLTAHVPPERITFPTGASG